MTIGLKVLSVLVVLSTLSLGCAGDSQSSEQAVIAATSAVAPNDQELATADEASSIESFFSPEILADGQPVAAYFEGKGSSELGPLVTAKDYSCLLYTSPSPRDRG